MLTHGADAEPSGKGAGAPAAAGDLPGIGGAERQPVCASEHHQHVLYGYPADRSSRSSSVRATILAEIKRMNAALNEAALASGGRTADYKVKCDSGREIRIDVFRSTEPDAQTTFAGVLSSARAAGFDSRETATTGTTSCATPTAATGTSA